MKKNTQLTITTKNLQQTPTAMNHNLQNEKELTQDKKNLTSMKDTIGI